MENPRSSYVFWRYSVEATPKGRARHVRALPFSALANGYDRRMHARAAHLIRSLDLAPHPEGGHFRRIHAASAQVEYGGHPRPALTAIQYLLARGEYSHWHRVDAEESWHWQAGGALELLQYDATTAKLTRTRLDALAEDGQPLVIVPAGTWQAARPLSDYTLVACTVAPGFVWEGFELLDNGSELAHELERLGVLHLHAFPTP